MTLPLEGVKVVDLSEHGFVPSAAAILGDWGADVVKVERLDGDAMRGIIGSGMVPTVDGVDFLFELVNRNKRGIALDIETPEGRAVFERLVAWADVYITNQLPRVRRKLRTEPADLMAINPRLVFAKGSGRASAVTTPRPAASTPCRSGPAAGSATSSHQPERRCRLRNAQRRATFPLGRSSPVASALRSSERCALARAWSSTLRCSTARCGPWAQTWPMHRSPMPSCRCPPLRCAAR